MTSTISSSWAIGETCRPCLAASATSGPAMATEIAGGSTVVIARLSDRKISTSSTITNKMDRNCTLLPVLPDAFCWSTWIARSPAACAWSPGGRCAAVIAARTPSTTVLA